MKSLHLNLCLAAMALVLPASDAFAGSPSKANTAAFLLYSQTTEARLAEQHRSLREKLALSPAMLPSLQQNGLVIEDLTPFNPPSGLDGVILRHWRGTAFVPGARAVAFDRLLRNVSAYPQRFAPEIIQTRILNATQEHMLATLRVRQKHVITVVLDVTYDITFGQGYSISRSTGVDEIASPGTPVEHALSPSDNHGFLWRQNTFWSYEERDGGLYLQIESLSLSRSIPRGLGWAVGPYVNSIPRESLEFTLRSAANALRK